VGLSIPKERQGQYKYAEPKPFRTCKMCKQKVSKDLFWKDKSQWDGLERVCKDCNKLRMTNRRYAKKLEIIEYLGGECVECKGTLETIHWTAFDCNHKDPSKKEFTISQKGFNLEKLKDELDKCELLCSNCHRKVTHENKDNIEFKGRPR
jgi:hypothetical protein